MSPSDPVRKARAANRLAVHWRGVPMIAAEWRATRDDHMAEARKRKQSREAAQVNIRG